MCRLCFRCIGAARVRPCLFAVGGGVGFVRSKVSFFDWHLLSEKNGESKSFRSNGRTSIGTALRQDMATQVKTGNLEA